LRVVLNEVIKGSRTQLRLIRAFTLWGVPDRAVDRVVCRVEPIVFRQAFRQLQVRPKEVVVIGGFMRELRPDRLLERVRKVTRLHGELQLGVVDELLLSCRWVNVEAWR